MAKRFGDGTRKLALIALLLSGAVVNEALADTLIIQGSTTFARRLMEPQQGDDRGRC